MTSSSLSDLAIIFDFQNKIVEQVLQSNLGYLSISVTMIIGLGAVFYLFNLKPLEKNLSEQKEYITKIKSEITKTSEQINDVLRKVDTARKQMVLLIQDGQKELQREQLRIDITNEWYLHYQWKSSGIKSNEFSTLICTLALSVDFQKKYQFTLLTKLILEEIIDLLNRFRPTKELLTETKISTVLAELTEFDTEKAKILQKISA